MPSPTYVPVIRTGGPVEFSEVTLTGATAATDVLTTEVTGDSVPRLTVDADGSLRYGSGAATADTSLARASTAQLRITPTANASNSSSVGGALNITNTGSTGAGLVVYSTQAAPAGHLIVARANSATFNQAAIYAEYVGTSHAVSINHQGSGLASSALNVASSNTAHSALGVSGVETDRGTVKVTHTGTGGDGNAAALSLDLAGVGTAAQGIFITSTNGAGGTTGDLIEVRNGGSSLFKVSAAGVVTQGTQRLAPGEVTPQDHALEAWTHDPFAAASSAIAVNGTLYLVRLNIRRAVTLDTLWWVIGTAGAGAVAGQNWVGLYDSTGARLAQTGVDADITSAGTKSTAITPQNLAAGSFVWVAFLFNAGTAPTLLRGSSFESSPSINLAAASRRAAVNGTGLTALPASITPASNVTTGCMTYFAALSE